MIARSEILWPNAVNEMESLSEVDELETTNQEGAERGRLFVRVVGLKDLKLPLPRSEWNNHICDGTFANDDNRRAFLVCIDPG